MGLPTRTFDEIIHQRQPGLHRRLLRDVKCAAVLTVMVWRNLTLGRRMRARYKAAKAAGEPIYLDG